jgi:DNA-binding CsgD family transcriptional regulator/Flp pilus assembly protein TadD
MTTAKRATRRGRSDEGAFTEAFLAADYPRCRDILNDFRDPMRKALLTARIDFREQNWLDIIESLAGLAAKNAETGIERDILLGAAYGHTGDYTTARLRLDRALEKAQSVSQLYADALFGKALLAWLEHEHRESESLMQAALEDPSPNNRARAHVLLSWIAVRRRDVGRQIKEMSSVLDVLERADEPDEYYRAKALLTLALLSRELPLHDESLRVRATYSAMRWAPGTKLPQFQTLRYIGWMDALQGDELAAFRSFRAASALAPSEHWRVLCLTDRAYLARNTGERTFAQDVLHEAHELAQNLSWHETQREERSSLFVLAELFATIDPALSQKYLAQFRSLNTAVMLGISYDDDPRTRAFATYSAGKAMFELGEKEEAIAMLSEAREIFDAFHYGWRTALCALALYRATGDAAWLIEARGKIAPWPKSWIAREIAEAGDAGADSRLLSKAQRRVLELLLEGKSNAGIAKSLERSPYTVRNHIAQLFRTYNVTNRTQLAGLFRTQKRAKEED